jgi:hypothetical protein
MQGQLNLHLHTKNTLVSEQHGYKKGMPTDNATSRITKSVFKSINQKTHVRGIFCDLAKACYCNYH